MAAAPPVSVLLCVYNGAATLRAAVDSILNQRYGDFECIVIDDGSTDQTDDVVMAINDQRLRRYRLATNLGLAAARHYAFCLARGKWLAIMDADDIAHPGRLLRQVDYLQQRPDITVLGSNMNLCGGEPPHTATRVYEHDADIKAAMLTLNKHMMNPTTMLVREWMQQHPTCRLSPQYDRGEDLNLWLRMVEAGAVFANLADVLLDYRIKEKTPSEPMDATLVLTRRNLALQAVALFFPQLSGDESHLLGQHLAYFQLAAVSPQHWQRCREIIQKAQSETHSLYGENRDFINRYLDYVLLQTKVAAQ